MTSHSKLHVLAALALFAGTLGTGAVHAADDSVESNTVFSTTSDTALVNDDWSFALAPYVWTTGISGDVGIAGAPAVAIDVSARDVLENLDMAFMGVGVLRYGRFGLFTDIVYADLESDSTNTPGPLFGSAKVETKTFFVTPMLEYQAVNDGWSELNVMAGMRVWYSETDFSLSGGLLNGRSFSDDATWVDPTVGLRGRIYLDQGLWLNGWGIIGGFDVGSQFMWDVLGGINYDVNDWASVEVGYRATSVNYSDDGYIFDVTMQGPVIGAVFRF